MKTLHRQAKGTYGARRISEELIAQGELCGRTKASTLMGLAGVSVKHLIIFHSDRGSQYCSYGFQKMLQGHKTLSSMS